MILLSVTTAIADVRVEVRYGHGQEAVAGAITPLVIDLTSTEGEPLGVRVRTRPGTTLGAGEVCQAADVLTRNSTKRLTFLYRPYARTRPIVELSFDRRVYLITREGRGESPVSETTVLPPPRPPMRGSESYARFTALAVGHQAGHLPKPPEGIRILPMEERDLADVWHAYDGIDVVLLRNPAEEAKIDPGRVTALLRYVELGGRLVISSRRPDRLKEIGLYDLLPADLAAPVLEDLNLRDAAAAFRDRNRSESIQAPTLLDLYELRPREGSRVLAAFPGTTVPIVVERTYGYGTIVVTAFDTARFEPLPKLWAISFYSVLFGGDTAAEASYAPEQNLGRLFPSTGSFFGGEVDDQPVPSILRLLRAGAVRAPPMGLLFLFMVLYILAVGPIDYWVLKKRRMLKWSAFSFLSLAILFSVTAWFVSFYLFAGADRVNRVTFADILPEGEGAPDRLVLFDMAGYYAPRGSRLLLEPEGDTVHVSDLADPASYEGSGGLRRDPVELRFPSVARATGEIVIPFRSLRTTRSVVTRDRTVPIDVAFSGSEVTVRNGLDFPLRDVTLYVGRRVLAGTGLSPGFMEIGDLDPGEEATVALRPRRGHYANVESLSTDGGEAPSRARLAGIAKSLLPVTWASLVREAPDGEWTAHFRTLVKIGLDRSPALRRGGSLLAAWTDERDPFGLSDGDADGFSLTLIRKVVRP
jgi:hypothetical protein